MGSPRRDCVVGWDSGLRIRYAAIADEIPALLSFHHAVSDCFTYVNASATPFTGSTV